MSLPRVDRRQFLLRSTAVFAGGVSVLKPRAASGADPVGEGPFQAMGMRVGEVRENQAVVWTRLTQAPDRVARGFVVPPRARDEKKRGKGDSKLTESVDGMDGACPGAPGRARLRYGLREDLSDAQQTDWMEATAENDFICKFVLTGLQAGAWYHCASEVSGPGGTPAGSEWRARFQTAPPAESPSNLRFCVMTCQGYADRGHPDGHDIYPAMQALAPRFACLTGDLVYYDSGDPDAVNERLARYHWERMFSLPRLRDFLRNHSAYWLKDDHDTLSNDSGPGASMGEFTFAQGQKIFKQQAPMPESAPGYRTVRWGRDLQIWFVEGRDFRSKNKSPDGPEKTIWGAEQKAWFKQTVLESSATWKVLVSPTPLVGPDRKNKHDNHSNENFTHEGSELREWIQAHAAEQLIVVCGDRHWQYHSVDPQTGVREFSVGPASDAHAGGSPGLNAQFHRFHRVGGGFLSVTLERVDPHSRIVCELRDVNGRVVHTWEALRRV